jgi:hypothetical protein
LISPDGESLRQPARGVTSKTRIMANVWLFIRIHL